MGVAPLAAQQAISLVGSGSSVPSPSRELGAERWPQRFFLPEILLAHAFQFQSAQVSRFAIEHLGEPPEASCREHRFSGVGVRRLGVVSDVMRLFARNLTF